MEHQKNCGCSSCKPFVPEGVSRKDFLRKAGAAVVGLGLSPLASFALTEDKGKAREFLKSRTLKEGRAQHITLLHTTDIHGQVNVHDEFFWENNQAVYKKRGGFAHLKTLINQLRKENPNNLLFDGGDCFQGSALAALSEGQALIPLMNNLDYNLMLPGNWEVAYGKKMMLKDMGAYHAPKVCANMFHQGTTELMFPPYQTFYLGGIKIGVIGYNDPLTPIRQSPAYSLGMQFTEPEKNSAHYIKLLREQERCDLVIALTHMGMAQQIYLANQPYAEGLDYIFGADTHERIRKPLQGKYARITEPGAFASFIGKMDLLLENGKIKEEAYELIEVDPEKYPADQEMLALIEKAQQPYKDGLKKVLGKSTTPVVRYFVIETPADNLIADALYWKAKTDIAVSNGFRFCPPLVPDPTTKTAEITKEYLWSLLPVDSEIKAGEITGKQLWDWLELELEKVFAKDPTQRYGGWFIRFQGMKVTFKINEEIGKRLQEVTVGGKPLDLQKTYTMSACEREGDPDDVLCRLKNVKKPKKLGYGLHQVMEEYLKEHPVVSPVIEGRAHALDAPATLLSQVSGINYEFR